MSDVLIEKKAKSRRTILIVAMVCFAPFILARLMYYYWQPSGRVNYGDLISGVMVPKDSAPLLDGKSFDFNKLYGKWVYVTVDSAQCDAYCENKLWKIRQVRKTQGKYPERIERVWLISDDAPIRASLLKEYDGMWMARVKAGPLLSIFPVETQLRDGIYLVDPLGNIVLRYPKDADPTRMKKDITRLLSVSRIG